MWSLLDQRQYSSLSVQYSRGCPFNCDFCSVTAMLGRSPRGKDPAQVIAELEAIRLAGWTGTIFVVDDNFIGRHTAVKKDLLPEMVRWQEQHGPTPLYTQVSIDLADDPDLVAQMVRSGFDTVFVGIETTDVASLNECGKRQNRGRDLAENVRMLQHAGLEVQAGFIVGFDHDTSATFQAQVEFIQRTGIVTAMVGLLQAIGGTRLYERMKKENRLAGGSTGDNVGLATNIVPSMGIEALRSGYARLLEGIYSPAPTTSGCEPSSASTSCPRSGRRWASSASARLSARPSASVSSAANAGNTGSSSPGPCSAGPACSPWLSASPSVGTITCTSAVWAD